MLPDSNQLVHALGNPRELVNLLEKYANLNAQMRYNHCPDS